MTKTALLIGVSEYRSNLTALPSSINDVNALADVLKNPAIGDFHEVKTLLNPDVEQMQSEIEVLFAEAASDDLVLLYFSGHGIKDDTGRLYFTTSGTRKNKRNQLVKATMVPASFVHDMMTSCQAKRQGIILDCCFSGAFDPALAVKDDSSIDLKGQLGAEGRVVMASSNHLQLSFGKKEETGLSVYTQHVVEGLSSGRADIDEDGVISVRDLHKYVSHKIRKNTHSTTPKLITFKDLGFDIVLAKSPLFQKTTATTPKQKLDFGKISLPISDTIDKRDYLPNFLEPYEALVQDLRCGFEDILPRSNGHSSQAIDLEERLTALLNIIQDVSDANFAIAIAHNSQCPLTVLAQSDFLETGENQQLLTALRTHVLPTASTDSIFNPDHHGIYKQCVTEGKDLHSYFVFIPLNPGHSTTQSSSFLLIAGLPESSSYLGDAFGKIISSFYINAQASNISADLVEAAIIDDLKEAYKFLSPALYNRRFLLFCKRLKQMTVYFEPILELDSLSISGWEALARDPETTVAPQDLFNAAEMWGVQFMVELDQYFLRVAAEKYRIGRLENKQNRAQEILPLSVNVYPESIANSAYFKTVEELIKEDGLIPGKKLILEISEKTSLPKYEQDDGDRKASWIGFRDELLRYVRELKVRFAIDDFGVEHASVSQLAGLQPPYIKVDREILFHDSRDIIIDFVHELGGSNSLAPPSVILEGVDCEAPVGLDHLKDIGVNYIQGHIVNKAQPNIYRLSEEKITELKTLLLVS